MSQEDEDDPFNFSPASKEGRRPTATLTGTGPVPAASPVQQVASAQVEVKQVTVERVDPELQRRIQAAERLCEQDSFDLAKAEGMIVALRRTDYPKAREVADRLEERVQREKLAASTRDEGRVQRIVSEYGFREFRFWTEADDRATFHSIEGEQLANLRREISELESELESREGHEWREAALKGIDAEVKRRRDETSQAGTLQAPAVTAEQVRAAQATGTQPAAAQDVGQPAEGRGTRPPMHAGEHRVVRPKRSWGSGLLYGLLALLGVAALFLVLFLVVPPIWRGASGLIADVMDADEEVRVVEETETRTVEETETRVVTPVPEEDAEEAPESEPAPAPAPEPRFVEVRHPASEGPNCARYSFTGTGARNIPRGEEWEDYVELYGPTSHWDCPGTVWPEGNPDGTLSVCNCDWITYDRVEPSS